MPDTVVPDILDHENNHGVAPTLQQYPCTVEKSRELLMSEIEATIQQLFASIAVGEPFKLPMTGKSTSFNRNQQKRKAPSLDDEDDFGSNMQQQQQQQQTDCHNRSFFLSVSRSTQTLARYLSVMQMIYEAIAYKIVLTKRDMFYRNVDLFGKQIVVDMIVDDISRHYNVPRSSLNVSAASKGLIFGPVIMKLKNDKILECMSNSSEIDDGQGILIPPIHQVTQVQCKAKCMIIIEKEATFRYLVSIGFCQSLPQGCVLVTGKGYPDLSTRQFVKYFSTHFPKKPILALMDGDPHGLDIYATYKWGTRAMAFDLFNLAVDNIELIGLTCQDRREFRIPPHCFSRLTDRDKAKCLAMVRTYNHDETPGQSQLIERGWRDVDSQLASQGHQAYIQEVFKLLKSEHKCELQALNHDGPFSLTHYLLKKLSNYI